MKTLTGADSSDDVPLPFWINIKSLRGPTFTLSVKASDTIGNVKTKIQGRDIIPVDRQYPVS